MTFTERAKRLTLSLLGALAFTTLAASLQAQEIPAEVEKRIRERLEFPSIDLGVDTIEASEIPGMYRVQLERGPVVYATEDANHFILGDLYSVSPGGLVNVAELRRSEVRRELVDAVALEEKIVFAADGDTRAVIEVFTDVSCFYCQKLHQEVPELNRRGVEVRYLAYPREGLGSSGFRQLATAWCAKDRQNTLTRLKSREKLNEDVCPGNPVAQHFELGQQVGVRGTPAIVMPSGTLVPGYRGAEDLIEALGLTD